MRLLLLHLVLRRFPACVPSEPRQPLTVVLDLLELAVRFQTPEFETALRHELRGRHLDPGAIRPEELLHADLVRLVSGWSGWASRSSSGRYCTRMRSPTPCTNGCTTGP